MLYKLEGESSGAEISKKSQNFGYTRYTPKTPRAGEVGVGGEHASEQVGDRDSGATAFEGQSASGASERERARDGARARTGEWTSDACVQCGDGSFLRSS